MKSYIVLIRHGITEGIQNKWFYGWTDLPVVKEGYEELQRFMDEGIYPEVPDDTKFYTTDLQRTVQTLKYIYGDVPHTEIPELREISFGEWECHSFKELRDKNGWEEWMNDTEGKFVFPGGDSMSSFLERIDSGIKKLLAYHGLQEIAHRHSGRDAVSVLVCHGGTISAIMLDWFSKERSEFWNWLPSTGLGYIVTFENGEPANFEPINDWKKFDGNQAK